MGSHRLTAIAVALLLTGCVPIDQMKEDIGHSLQVAARLEKLLGVKPSIRTQWSDSSFRSIDLSFKSIPANVTVAELAAKSKEAVAEEFKQKPAKVVIVLELDP